MSNETMSFYCLDHATRLLDQAAKWLGQVPAPQFAARMALASAEQAQQLAAEALKACTPGPESASQAS